MYIKHIFDIKIMYFVYFLKKTSINLENRLIFDTDNKL